MRRAILLATLAALSLAATARDASALDPRRAVHQYTAREWGVDQGLPQNSVKAVAQTPDGYLWLATEEGLVRFDGVRFTLFSDTDEKAFADNDVVGLCVDPQGALWLGTRGGGVLRYADGAFRAWRRTDGLIDDITSSVACAADGDVWVGTPRGATQLHAGRIVRSFNESDGLPSEWVSAIAVDTGAVWIGTDEGLVRIAAGRVLATLDDAGDRFTAPVTSLAHAKDGSLLVGSRGSVSRLANGALTQLAGSELLPNRSVSAIVEDSDRELWIGMREGGVFRRTPEGAWSHFTRELGLADDVIASMFEDREHDLWIGTETAGVQRLANPKVVTYGKLDGITGSLVWSVFEDRDGNIWAGTRGAGVHRRAPDGMVTTWSTKEGLPADTVYGIHQAPDGTMWFGTEGGGAAHLVDGKFKVLSTKNGLSHDWVRAVLADRAGNVWIGTEGGGLDRVMPDGTTMQHYAAGGPAVQSNSVRRIAEDRTGTIWFGTEGGGVTRFKDGVFETWRKSDGLSDDSVISITLDDDDTLWLGTYHGLTRRKDGKFAHATTREGLFNNLVFTTLPGPGDTLWMSSNLGISSISKKDFDELAKGARATITNKSYGAADGMKVAECNGGSPAGVRAKDGKLWFANMGGLVMVDPAGIVANPMPPPVVIEEIDVNRAAMPLASSMRFAAGSKDFELRYTATSFVEPERVRFKYRLVGSDRDWVEAGTRRTAYYTNLAPGHYRFEVRAANNDGVWNDQGAGVDMYVAPYFWQTWWFYALVAASLVALGVAIVGVRVRQLRKYSRELERRVAERTAELNLAIQSLEAKDRRIQEDLEQARAFQQGILPILPAREDLRVGVAYQPADLVGGDVYDICEIGGGVIRVFMADTTGHGVQASLRTMVLRTEYDAVKRAAESPARVLEEVNRRLFARYDALELRCNAICFDVMVKDGRALVRYANCAQPPMLLASNGSVSEVYAPGPFLAMMDDFELETREVEMGPGDRLLVFTDGVFEQEDPKGEPFGFEPMGRIVADRSLDADAVVRELVDRVKAYAGRPLDDDVTVLCIERPG